MPFELRYKTPEGVLTLKANSYAVDWNQGTAILDGPRVLDPEGREILRLHSAKAYGLNFPINNVVVRASGLVGHLRRLESGRFDIQRFIPERKGPPTKIPFSVSLDVGRVLVEDLAGRRPFKRWITASRVDVRGIGEEWIASADARIESAGSIRINLQNIPGDGLLARGVTTGLQLQPLVEHLREIPEGRNLGFLTEARTETLQASGPLSIYIPAQQSLQVQTRLRAKATGFQFREFAADTANFDGEISQTSARGILDARLGAVQGRFNGTIIWGDKVSLGGKLAVSSPSRRALPRWAQPWVPTEIDFRSGTLDGWLDYRESSGVQIASRVTASSATAFGQTVLKPDINLSADGKNVRLAVNGAAWAGTPVSGAVLIGIDKPTVVGAFSVRRANLAALASRFGTRGLTGIADVSAIIGGTRTKPQVLLQAEGNGAYRLGETRLAGNFRAAGKFRDGVIDLQRAFVRSDAGFIRALGTISLKSNRLQLKVDLNGVELAKLRDDLKGNITASGILQGPLSNPQFTGRAIAIGVEAAGEDIPFAVGDLTATKTRLLADNLRIIKGSGEATGAVAINFASRALSGSLSARNILLNEYLGDEALGTITVPRLTLGGTLDKPRAAGSAYGENLLLAGIQIDRAQISSSLGGSVAHIDSATAQIGEGQVALSGNYDLDKKVGSFAVTGKNLSLERITPPGKAGTITGTLDGSAQINVRPSGELTGNASGSLQDVVLNTSEFGGGNWKLAFDGSALTGNASIGRLDRFFLVENLRYDVKREDLTAQVSVLNGALRDIYLAGRPFFPPTPPDIAAILDTANGNLDTTVAVSGNPRDPNLDVQVLEARDLVLRGQELGVLRTELNRVGELWTVQNFTWRGPQGDLVLSQPATINLAGPLYVDGELTNFDLSYLALVDPTWVRLRGNANLSFLAQGTVEDPQIRASLTSSNERGFGVAESGESFRINLDTITVQRAEYLLTGGYNGGIQASGKFFYRGFAGDIVAKIPLDFPLAIPDQREISASLTFPDVDLKDVARFAQALDMERSSGRLSGSISVTGPKNNLALKGSILAQADSIALEGIQTAIQAVVANVQLDDNKVLLTLNAEGSAGGQISAMLTSTLPEIRSAADQIARGDTASLLRTPVQGEIVTNALNVRQESKNRELGTYKATVSTKLAVSGPAAEPLVAGTISVSDTNVLLPSVFAGAGPGADLLFNPRFEIPIELVDVARFRTSTADVSLSGAGYLGGSLARPDFNGTLVLESGQLRLPTARVRLEEGGTIRPVFSVDAEGQSVTRVDVNLEGRTALTTNKFGDTAQRYNINLSITGDLLTEGGLTLRATSDPPDLSQDEILALLGQTDLLKSFESGTSQSETERRIREALVSFAVPQLTESFTSQLAQNLGLEYLNLEYNAFEGASVTFAKSLGKGLILQGRRQISPPVGNLKTQYDLQVNYRIPTKNRALNRLVFSVGIDQDRPWKMGLQYGFRF